MRINLTRIEGFLRELDDQSQKKAIFLLRQLEQNQLPFLPDPHGEKVEKDLYALRVMTKTLEKTVTDLDRFEAQMLKRSGYRKVHAQAETVSKVAAKIIRYRQGHSLSQATLAKAAGLSRKALNEIEGLVNTNPSLKTLEALAQAIHLPLAKLIA